MTPYEKFLHATMINFDSLAYRKEQPLKEEDKGPFPSFCIAKNAGSNFFVLNLATHFSDPNFNFNIIFTAINNPKPVDVVEWSLALDFSPNGNSNHYSYPKDLQGSDITGISGTVITTLVENQPVEAAKDCAQFATVLSELTFTIDPQSEKKNKADI